MSAGQIAATSGATPIPDATTEQAFSEIQKTVPFGHEHYSHRAPWLRAAVLGANDGLVSTAALMLGVAGGDSQLSTMVLTGVSGLVAGSLSMACGEYVSVSSQRDAEKADLVREANEFQKGPAFVAQELEELTSIYIAKGLRPELARQVATELHSASVEDIVRVHARDELGIDPDELSNPFQAAWTSALSFAAGAALPLLAGAFIADYTNRCVSVVIVTLVGLALFGGAGAYLGGAPMLRAIVRVVIGGGAAMGVTFGIGKAFGVSVA